ncbi:MAG: T9SS type A sorting domain-containing protein, partial [Ferruginibacter sp.]|nr:T9SS type A sorting domain-containing protein [Ferruginibacter sp.]
PATGSLIGGNSAPISTGFAGAEIVDVPIAGVTAGSSILPVSMQIINSASGDNPDNNAFTLPVTVLAGSGGVLPVKLESIDGFSEKCNAQLKWSTSNEVNLSKFEVEVSKDGASFDRAGTLNPSSANAGNYQFNTTQSNGKNYYRLKIIDKDGSFTYSKVIPISTSCSDKVVKVFPNPVKVDQLLNVNISGYDASVKGDLYSSTGQFVKSYVLKNGANNLSVENMAQGFYTLRVSENGSVTETFKLNVLK